ncbi:MAG: SIS domain-containing protein [Nitrospirae bacterium]|nr:SIS domain-containing protein [Nitrospirota bacterium]MCL5976717.1 SIS domain-containing protein [Nitrospirota bacterium]
MSLGSKKYYEDIINLMRNVRVTDGSNKAISFNQAVDDLAVDIIRLKQSGNKVMFIGNGASSSISSHMSVDYWKTGGIKAISFNDGALLTCISNDYGYKHVFEKPIQMFADEGDALVAISSSGRSENILCGVAAARQKKCRVITLSGFDAANPLSEMGDINFYVSAQAYGPVEIIHHSICHCVLDLVVSAQGIYLS